MKRNKFVSLLTLCLVLCLTIMPVFGEEADVFSFRNGIRFGMNEKEIKEIEAANGQAESDGWQSMEVGSWHAIGPEESVQVSTEKGYVIYFLKDDQMEAASYDFRSSGSTVFITISGALTGVYGQRAAAEPKEIIRLMDCFSPGFYKESDITSAYVWRQDQVVIYQFYYSESAFVVFYTNPAFDYSSGSESAVDTTGV